MDTNRKFGIVMIILGGLMLAFEATGSLVAAPLLLIFGTLGAVGAVALGVRAVIGKF